ncbi:hypothetical protein A2U01_0038746 [Trifolium medium]|uniref:Uncharacterized protein n=1 Tax=Trifolium medium TaxID=97028 RepID=A0A392Q0U7_9FABA|nr:hypothetical protein [Trifolium medium]
MCSLSEAFPTQDAQSQPVPEQVTVIKSARVNTPGGDRPQLQVEEVVTFSMPLRDVTDEMRHGNL